MKLLEPKPTLKNTKFLSSNKEYMLFFSHESNNKIKLVNNSKCTHNGPHGSRYHGLRGGGWCYWCYICNPSNPKSY